MSKKKFYKRRKKFPNTSPKNPEKNSEVQEELDEDLEEEPEIELEESAFTEEQEKAPEPAPQKEVEYEVVSVVFQKGGKSYYFDPNGIQAHVNEHLVVDTARGMEYVTVKEKNHMVPESQVKLPLRKCLRQATKDDDLRKKANTEIEIRAFTVFPELAAQYNLEMKLSSVECAFDNSKLLFYFTSETRIDFRELVKELAAMFHMRIELRQIGIRDEAKMLGGIGLCGREFCCSTFLDDFAQVTIKMAKDQGILTNSSKSAGACGRLLCCLKYEHPLYEEALQYLPKVGSTVITPDGEGVVTELKPIQFLVRVRLSNEKETLKYYEYSQLKLHHSNS